MNSTEKHCTSEEKLFSINKITDERQNLILAKTQLSESIIEFKVHCPGVANYCGAGQFIVVRGAETGERIPLTIADFDDQGSITLVVQILGAGTGKLNQLEVGDRFLDVVGPLGEKSHIKNYGTVVMIGGGVGVAPVYPIQRALKKAGNRIISIMGARNKDLLFWQDHLESCADELHIATDDGSVGTKGFVTTVLQGLIEKGEKIDRVIAIGPTIMMSAVSKVTKEHDIKTIVSLNSIMVDGTGMCGGCRVEVGGNTKFACAEGPEFDGHEVNFDLLISRLQTYDREELAAQGHFRNLKERLQATRKSKTRVPMPHQDAKARATNFNEVALGYTAEMAVEEASRCLNCKKAFCVPGCPVCIDIPGFISLIKERKFMEAAKLIKKENNLPAVCGRVCPQESQCEALCICGKKGEPVAIGRLERFVADYEASQGVAHIPDTMPEWTGKRIAVVGAGPSGLTCAADLALLGHKVTVFEALHAPGGVLMYGIPEFRLPKTIVKRETDYLERLGIDFCMNVPVGQSAGVPELLENGFDAVFVGTGAGLPWFLGIPGENHKGVYSSNEFLTRINLMKAYKFPEYDTPVLPARNVAVVGGGNVAMDCARSALRLGAENVYIVYRRTRAEMPARLEEIEHAVEEGVQLLELHNPVEVLADDEGWVQGLACIQMELGEPDDSGRRRPVPIPNSEFVIDVDQFILAIGQGPNPILTKNWDELELDRRGNIPVNEKEMTNVPGVFAGGDIVTGAATVIEAMGAGKRAAIAIDEFVRNR